MSKYNILNESMNPTNNPINALIQSKEQMERVRDGDEANHYEKTVGRYKNQSISFLAPMET